MSLLNHGRSRKAFQPPAAGKTAFNVPNIRASSLYHAVPVKLEKLRDAPVPAP